MAETREPIDFLVGREATERDVRQVIMASVEIEAEIKSKKGTGPTIEIWRRWRRNAQDSLAQLVTLNVFDPHDHILIATHQNEVKRYVEYAMALRDIFHEGVIEERDLTQQERRDLIAIIKGMPEEERAMIDLGPDREDIEPSVD